MTALDDGFLTKIELCCDLIWEYRGFCNDSQCICNVNHYNVQKCLARDEKCFSAE